MNTNYYWVCAVHSISQRPIVQGPHNTEMEARQWAFANIPNENFEVYAFPTVNKIAARDYFKNKRIEQTKTLDIAFRRAKYKV